MKKLQEKLGFYFLIILLAIYPIYTNLLYGSAEDQVIRHLKFIEGESYFFNPWQYRVFAPYLIESIAIIFREILPKTINEENLYFAIFKSLRFAQHLIIFYFSWKFYRIFCSNRMVLLSSIMVLSASIGSATFVSDFSFNTYFDVIFYLLAIILIFSEKNIVWFLPLTFIGALNRETSLLLPFLLFINYKNFLSPEKKKKHWLVFLTCLVIFGLTFISIRTIYGYQPPAPIGIETGWPILKFNLTDPITITELFSTLNILPLFCLFNIRKADLRLQILFWLLVPAWFFVHFWLVWAHETRIFLVLFVVVFIPVVLDLIQKEFEKLKFT